MACVLLRPSSLSQALSLLAENADARPIAGGATLVAMMNADLIAPPVLVSLDAIAELRGITETADGGLRIGAMTRHRETASDTRLGGTLRMVAEAASVVANPVVRNMGTMGGSVAFFDPAADYPAALVAAGAVIEIAGIEGCRRLPAAAFFVDWYTTALRSAEIVSAVHLPAPARGGSTYRKVARTAGDYAIASCAVRLARSGELRVAVGACGPVPVTDPEGEKALFRRLDDDAALEAFLAGLAERADPVSDVRGSAAYRLTLIPRIVRAAIGDLRRAERAAA